MGTSSWNLKGLKQIIKNNHNMQNTIIGNYDVHNTIPNNNKKITLSLNASKYSKSLLHNKCSIVGQLLINL